MLVLGKVFCYNCLMYIIWQLSMNCNTRELIVSPLQCKSHLTLVCSLWYEFMAWALPEIPAYDICAKKIWDCFQKLSTYFKVDVVAINTIHNFYTLCFLLQVQQNNREPYAVWRNQLKTTLVTVLLSVALGSLNCFLKPVWEHFKCETRHLI